MKLRRKKDEAARSCAPAAKVRGSEVEGGGRRRREGKPGMPGVRATRRRRG